MTTGKPVTRLEHARHLKQAGLPLNTPVEDRTFSAAYSKHWLPLMDAHAAFMRAIGEFSDTQAPGKLTLAKRRLAALDAATARCVDFVSELDTSDAEQDMHEAALLQFFITERALPFRAGRMSEEPWPARDWPSREQWAERHRNAYWEGDNPHPYTNCLSSFMFSKIEPL